MFQGVAGATFRFYFYDDTDSSANSAIVHRIDDVILNGSLVPEPGSLALAGLAGTMLLLRRRK